MATFNVKDALKATQWERAKGELRAMCALQGSYNTGDSPPNVIQEQTDRWLELRRRTEDFIELIENDGLHE